jgi:hypothetical protein
LTKPVCYGYVALTEYGTPGPVRCYDCEVRVNCILLTLQKDQAEKKEEEALMRKHGWIK